MTRNALFAKLLTCLPGVTALINSVSQNGIPARAALTRQVNLDAHESPTGLQINKPNITSKWIDGSDLVQIVEVYINNTDPTNYLTEADNLVVEVLSDSVDTVVRGTLKRLGPRQAAIVQIGIKNKPKAKAGSQCTGIIVANYGNKRGGKQATQPVSGTCGFIDYTATKSSVNPHLAPDWFNDLKYGIFIHWGPYAVPAYGNVGKNENYAEWYWSSMQYPNDKTQTYQYHLKTYGKDVNYDDFFANFTDRGFDPQEWVDLFSDAGAQYFVPTTKHHDGFALFNFSTAISKRSSIHYGPKRDIIKDLFAAAKKYQPHLRLGTYFSMPEWFNPAYKKYGFSAWPGGPPTNPYTKAEIPYTGFVEVKDFVKDIQLPQMRTLADEYGIDIMWCDITSKGNNATIFASEWLNSARKNKRQVTFNNRCGILGDFDTPEYVTNGETVTRKWEASRGMDPHSYGYNAQTPDSAYLSGEQIVHTLVDMVSKNGNFLLDIGPTGNGSIPQIMQNNLRDAGRWIKSHGESIFRTRFWTVKPGSDPFRYTTTKDAFYIHHIGKPSETLDITDPVPYLPGDKVTVVGGRLNGKTVPASWNGVGSLKLTLGKDVLSGDRYIWTFKIQYH
ncbi:Glycoside hydrolase, subgroup, catalytic core, partial [Metarhizium majus ARSEF 297]